MSVYKNHAILFVKTEEELRDFVAREKISWSNLVQANSTDFPLFKLVEDYSGQTLSEKVFRCIHPAPACHCGKDVVLYGWKKGYAKYCSAQCRHSDKKLNAEIAEKTKATMFRRHGGFTLSSVALREKVESTNIKKYGVAQAAASPEVRKKIELTNVGRYGGRSPASSKNTTDKMSSSNRERVRTERIADLSDRYEFIDGDDVNLNTRWKCLSCDSIFVHNWDMKQRTPICRTCHPMVKGTSKEEQELFEFVRSLVPSAKSNARFYLDGKKYFELDIQAEKFGIEYNGLWWHSELAGKGRNYHRDKQKHFSTLGIRTIFIFENEWKAKKELCKQLIRYKLGFVTDKIYARNTRIAEVDRAQGSQFFESNHIAGNAKAAVYLGLFENETLVACASFAPDRFGKDKKVFELVRFCTKAGISVVGGLSKLVNNFRRHKRCDIKTFCDLRWGDGKGYLAAGFSLEREIPPTYWYFTSDRNDDTIYHRSVFQKKKLLKSGGLNESDLSEWDLAQAQNLNRIWDCGHLVFYRKFNND